MDDIFKDGTYEGIAYLREISTGREMVSVSDENSNISIRGLEMICFWLIRLLRDKGFSLEECEKGLHEMVNKAFELDGIIKRE
ncbi:MAG: hypothetical protein IJI14_17620 [Anaerolineaceae bacterium]|nr:hypothetical protein [Anaerolineaceae bacterium]